jgi:subtilase family serine protease
VSALADPFTGFAIIFTDAGTQYAEAGIGGTSLASPIFTAIWAIADQYNGGPLGHAGEAVTHLKHGQITDVVGTTPLNTSDVTGTVYDSNGATFYSATALFADADAGQLQTQFVSALWPIASDEAIAITFGVDSSLTTNPGWDNATGYGEPNGLPFIQGVTGKTTGAALVKK